MDLPRALRPDRIAVKHAAQHDHHFLGMLPLPQLVAEAPKLLDLAAESRDRGPVRLGQLTKAGKVTGKRFAEERHRISPFGSDGSSPSLMRTASPKRRMRMH